MQLYWGMRAAFALSPRIPLRLRYGAGMLSGEAAYWCWPSKRDNTRRNMTVVVGDGPRAAAMARASWRNYGRYIVDFFNLPNVKPHEIVGGCRVRGWEHLDRAIAEGHGAIFVTGHYGLWDYAPVVVSNRYPGHVHVVAESFDSPRVDALIQGQRVAQGSTVIPMTSVRQMVRVLRNNHILALLVDRPVHGDGVPITFFGRQTVVPGGAATLAAMTGAAILPGYIVHHEDGGYDGVIMPPVEHSRTGDRAADVRRMTQGIFSALEQIIAREPAYWYMFRDMWATPAAARQEVGAFA